MGTVFAAKFSEPNIPRFKYCGFPNFASSHLALLFVFTEVLCHLLLQQVQVQPPSTIASMSTPQADGRIRPSWSLRQMRVCKYIPSTHPSAQPFPIVSPLRTAQARFASRCRPRKSHLHPNPPCHNSPPPPHLKNPQ